MDYSLCTRIPYWDKDVNTFIDDFIYVYKGEIPLQKLLYEEYEDGKESQNWVERCKKKRNISQTELAGILNIDVSVIKGWEAGASFPTVEVLQELSDLLNTTTEMLLFSESRKALNIAKLDETKRSWVLTFYRVIIKNAK